MVATLNVIMSCENLGLEEPFQGTCFGHAMLKACQYDTTNNKVSMASMTSLSKLFTQTFRRLEKLGKGWLEWTRCVLMWVCNHEN
jgi:hypothetical protein